MSYTIQSSTHNSLVNGFSVSLALQACTTMITIFGLTNPFLQTQIQSILLEIPSKWHHQFDLPTNFNSPSGINQVIIGNDNTFCMPTEISRFHNLSLFKSNITGNYIVSGHNSPAQFQFPFIRSLKTAVKDFHTQDKLWLESVAPENFQYIPRACPAHSNTNCQDCIDILESKTPFTRFEESQLDKSLHFQPPTDASSPGRWIINAIHNSLISSLPSYRSEVLNMMSHLESRLVKKPEILSQFNKEMDDKISSGLYVFEEDFLKDHPELKEYPESFAPLNFSQKLNSTTSCRPVLNCSFKTSNNPSYNDCQFVGSSLNIKIIDILLIFRSFPVLGISDIKKMYNNLKLNPQSIALNKMMYKRGGLGSNSNFEPLLSLVLQFGSRQSQYLSNAAKIKSSEMFIASKDPSAHQMVKNSYSDDVFAGGSTLPEVKERAMTISEGLAQGHFFTKPWTFSGEPSPDIKIGSSNHQSSLGLLWAPEQDHWKLSISVNLSKKYRGIRNSNFQINTPEDAKEFLSKSFTKRQALRLTHQPFDLLCLFIQLRTNLNLLYRHLITNYPNLKYEDQVPQHLVADWISIIIMILQCANISVPRYILTNATSNEAILAIFSDGSQSASCSRLFLRFEVAPDTFEARYLCGNSKIAPPGNTPAPRTETEAGLLGLRLAELVHKRMSENIRIKRTLLFTDSTILLGGLSNLSCQQKIFYSVRNSESQCLIKRMDVELYHVESHNQDADLGSKLNLSNNFALEDFYWRSSWLHLKESEWPVTYYTFDKNHIIDILNPKMITSMKTTVEASFLFPLIEKLKSFKKIHGVTSLLFLFSKNYRNILEASNKAKQFLLQSSVPSTEEIKGCERQFIVVKDEFYYKVKPRTLMVNGATKHHSLILVSGSSPIGKSLLHDLHIHVSSPQYEIANMFQNNYYITKSRKWFAKRQLTCQTCIKIRKLHLQSYIGSSHHLQAQKNVPPLCLSYIDIAGPFYTKLTRKVSKKVYILLTTCMWSRFTILTLLNSLTADSVLMGIREASNSIGGNLPSILYSDSASNFLPLQRTTDTSQNNDNNGPNSSNVYSNLKKLLHSHSIVLKTSSPKASWRQGKVEVMVSLLKNNLKRSDLYHKKLDISQWGFVLKKIQNILNSRPLNLRMIQDSLFVLTSNHLVFGKRDNFYPQDLDISTFSNINLYKSLQDLDNSITQFHQIWMSSYNIEMLKWTKWKHKSAIPTVDSIVYILDKQNKNTLQPTLGRVKRVISERTFEIEYDKKAITVDPNTYKVVKSSKKASIVRPIQQLCLLVLAPPISEEGVNVDPFDIHEAVPDVPLFNSQEDTNILPEDAPPSVSATTSTPEDAPPLIPIPASTHDEAPPSLVNTVIANKDIVSPSVKPISDPEETPAPLPQETTILLPSDEFSVDPPDLNNLSAASVPSASNTVPILSAPAKKPVVKLQVSYPGITSKQQIKDLRKRRRNKKN